MRVAIYTLLILINCSLTVANELSAKEKDAMATPPHFFNIGSTTSNSVLSMQCEGDKPYNDINCCFTETNIKKSSGQQEDDTCEIWQYTFFNIMHRVSKYRWVSELYGGGMRSIEQDPENPVLWKYSEVTNDTPSKTIIYTWDAPTKFTLNCKHIDFHGINKSIFKNKRSNTE